MKRFTSVDSAGLTPSHLRTRLGVEFGALFVLAPLGVAWWTDAIVRSGQRPRGVVFWALLSAIAVCLVLLLRDRTFDRRELWNWGRMRGHVGAMLARFAVLIGAVGVLIVVFMPERLFSFPRQAPAVWAVVMLVYPMLSVYPQELVYRAFIFHRYRRLFGSSRGGGGAMILASATAFGWAHILLQNWIAVAMTFVGGLLFSWTYARTRSLAGAWLEHALYGCAVFTLGLGQFFYAGAIGRA